MSDSIPATEADMSDSQLKAAVEDFNEYRLQFEKNFGYGIGALLRFTQDGRVEALLQLVKLTPAPSNELSEEDMEMAEVPDPVTVPNEPTTPENANNTPETSSESDSGGQPEAVAA